MSRETKTKGPSHTLTEVAAFGQIPLVINNFFQVVTNTDIMLTLKNESLKRKKYIDMHIFKKKI